MCFSRCLKSNVCICRSLTWRRGDHNAVSQRHALLCKWGSFIIVMLFMSVIHVERDAPGKSGIRHIGPALFTHSLLPEFSFVASKLNVLKQPTLPGKHQHLNPVSIKSPGKLYTLNTVPMKRTFFSHYMSFFKRPVCMIRNPFPCI